MLAVGLGLPEDEITQAGLYGYVPRSRCGAWAKGRSHLLAPTATNLAKYGHLNTCVPSPFSSLFRRAPLQVGGAEWIESSRAFTPISTS